MLLVHKNTELKTDPNKGKGVIMGILRGGRRIGNFDIRVGLPRDKSLVDIAKDPRLQRENSGAGQIQRFQSQINQGEGFARPNRYLIVIHPPQKN